MTPVARRYAKALFDLTDGKPDAVLADLHTLESALQVSDVFRDFLSDLALPRATKGSIMQDLCKRLGVGDLVQRFTGVLAANRRLTALPDAITAFDAMVAEVKGELTAHVRTASPLTDAQKKDLTTALENAHKATITLKVKEDPSLIGGLVVKVGATQVDTSVKSKIERLERTLYSTPATATA